MCWYLCSNQSSAFTVPQRTGNYSKRLLEVQSSQGAAWLMLHPLKELPQSSTALHFSDVEQQEGSRQITPGPGSSDSQAQPPCCWVWSVGCCRILNFPPFDFCSCQEVSIPRGLHPLHGRSWHFTGLGALSHQQKAAESDLSTNTNIMNQLQTLPSFKESAGEKGMEFCAYQKMQKKPQTLSTSGCSCIKEQ